MQSYGKITVVGFLIIFLIIPDALAQASGGADRGIANPQQLQLIVTPSEATLNVKEQLQFKSEIKGAGNLDVSKAKVEWRVLGNIGTISSSGLFTASDEPGRGMVSASAVVDKRTLVGHAVVKVAEGALPPGIPQKIAVVVKPGDVSLSPGESRQFTTDPAGKTQWRVIPPRLGSITDAGLFTAGSDSGRGMVIATVQTGDGTGIGRAYVVVGKNEPIASRPRLVVNISPKNAKVEKGGSVVFEAKIVGSNDNYPLEWDVYPKNLGHIEGTGYKVLFVAGTETDGRALITASVRTATSIGMDWSTVDVGNPGRLLPEKLKVTVSPDNASLKIGESILFTANISGSASATPSWSVAPRRIGTIDQNGIFTATGLGWGLVICKVNSTKGLGVGQARVYVGSGDASPLRISITPQYAEVFAGGDTVKFTAQVVDKQNRPATNASILWKVIPEDMGSIDQTGLFTSGDKTGQALITAKVEGSEGGDLAQARVSITDQVGRERLGVSIIGPQTLKLGEIKEYRVTVTDQRGKSINLNTAKFEWRVVPSNIGTITGSGDKVNFVPNIRGRGVIIVDVKSPEGSGTGRVSITVE